MQLTRRHKIQIGVWLGIILLFIIGAYLYLHYESFYPATDDAYVHANIVHIAAQVRGPVAKIAVQNHQLVHKGQLLFIINPKPYQLALQQAKAKLKLAQQTVAAEAAAVASAAAQVAIRKANYIKVKEHAARVMPLVQSGTVSKNTGDDTRASLHAAKSALRAAKAALQQAKRKLGVAGTENPMILNAKAALQQAQLNLGYTHVYAPATGYLSNFTLRVGSMINPYQPLFVLVENKLWWVNANFKETDIQRIHAGEPVKITLAMYPKHTFHGVVQSINPASGAAFSLLPPENASGNWVKVTQRIPVKIIITKDSTQFPLRVGASGNVTVNTTVTNKMIPVVTRHLSKHAQPVTTSQAKA